MHEFEAREGGSFRVSLTCDAPTGTGKSAEPTDTHHGHFAKLVPDEQVVEVVEFETADPGLRSSSPIRRARWSVAAKLTRCHCRHAWRGPSV